MREQIKKYIEVNPRASLADQTLTAVQRFNELATVCESWGIDVLTAKKNQIQQLDENRQCVAYHLCVGYVTLKPLLDRPGILSSHIDAQNVLELTFIDHVNRADCAYRWNEFSTVLKKTVFNVVGEYDG